jgi:hypothetical protein
MSHVLAHLARTMAVHLPVYTYSMSIRSQFTQHVSQSTVLNRMPGACLSNNQ